MHTLFYNDRSLVWASSGSNQWEEMENVTATELRAETRIHLGWNPLMVSRWPGPCDVGAGLRTGTEKKQQSNNSTCGSCRRKTICFPVINPPGSHFHFLYKERKDPSCPLPKHSAPAASWHTSLSCIIPLSPGHPPELSPGLLSDHPYECVCTPSSVPMN